jgi:hypothetical protein
MYQTTSGVFSMLAPLFHSIPVFAPFSLRFTYSKVGFLLRPRDRPSKSALSAAHVLRQNGASVQASVVLTEEDAAFAAAKNARHQAQAQSGRGDMVRKEAKTCRQLFVCSISK